MRVRLLLVAGSPAGATTQWEHATKAKKPARAFVDAMPLAASAAVGTGMVDATAPVHAPLACLLRQAPPVELATLEKSLTDGCRINHYLRF
jgi:hypothetical protein